MPAGVSKRPGIPVVYCSFFKNNNYSTTAEHATTHAVVQLVNHTYREHRHVYMPLLIIRLHEIYIKTIHPVRPQVWSNCHVTATFLHVGVLIRLVQTDTEFEIHFGLTLNMRGPSYFGLIRSISWLLMPWLLTSPCHQQPWYWLCRICRSWSYSRKDL